jgi:hypothetical protein
MPTIPRSGVPEPPKSGDSRSELGELGAELGTLECLERAERGERDAKKQTLIAAGLAADLDMTFLATVLKGNDDENRRNVKAVQQHVQSSTTSPPPRSADSVAGFVR